MQLVFEHESIHLVMQLFEYQGKIKRGSGKTMYTSHGTLFQTLARAFFGHTDFKHGLESGDVCTHLTRDQIPPGANVKFDHKGKIIQGVVVKHNPKTVEVIEIMPNKGERWRVYPNSLETV